MMKNIKWTGLCIGVGTLAFKLCYLILNFKITTSWWNSSLWLYVIFYATSIMTICASLIRDEKAKELAILNIATSVLLLFFDGFMFVGFAMSLGTFPTFEEGAFPIINLIHIVAGALTLAECAVRKRIKKRDFMKRVKAFNAERYVSNPCYVSSLPFWKMKEFQVPAGVKVIRNDELPQKAIEGTDERYFKLLHDLEKITRPIHSPHFKIVKCGTESYVNHINECYVKEGISTEELKEYKKRRVYDPDLWIAVADKATGQIVATGIAELDTRIGEGILEWIQVSPQYRHKGLGKFVVQELLWRMKDKAFFAVVSGKVDSESRPMALYRACGFINPVIWHVITENNS
ncbi:MAG: GNAT family N-acetyltransferase [Lachnospiraceae bacterium]|nr:GNAT family N-acetyltransferase [Lachnospiraceae bacterium]